MMEIETLLERFWWVWPVVRGIIGYSLGVVIVRVVRRGWRSARSEIVKVP